MASNVNDALWKETLVQLARARLTAGLKEHALTLAAHTDDTGKLTIRFSDLLELWNINTAGTARKYLAKMRTAGFLDYKWGGLTVDVWLLSFSLNSRLHQPSNTPGAARRRAGIGAQTNTRTEAAAPSWGIV